MVLTTTTNLMLQRPSRVTFLILIRQQDNNLLWNQQHKQTCTPRNDKKTHGKHTSTAGEKQRDSDRSRADLLPHGSYHRCHGSWLCLLFWSLSLVCVSSLHPLSVEVRAAVEFAGTDSQIYFKHAYNHTKIPWPCQWRVTSHIEPYTAHV